MSSLGQKVGKGNGDNSDRPRRRSSDKTRPNIQSSCSDKEQLLESSDEEQLQNLVKSDVKESINLSESSKMSVSDILRGPGSTCTSSRLTERKSTEIQLIEDFPPPVVQVRKFPPCTIQSENVQKEGLTAASCSSGSGEHTKGKDIKIPGPVPMKDLMERFTITKKSPLKFKSKGKNVSPKIMKYSTKPVLNVKYHSPTKKEKQSTKEPQKIESLRRRPGKLIRHYLSLLSHSKSSGSETQDEASRPTTSNIKTEDQLRVGGDCVVEAKETKPTKELGAKSKKTARLRPFTDATKHTEAKRPIKSTQVDRNMTPESSVSKKSPKRKGPLKLYPSLFGTPIEKVCDIVTKSGYDTSDSLPTSNPSQSEDCTSPGEYLISPLSKLSTEYKEGRSKTVFKFGVENKPLLQRYSSTDSDE